MLLVGNGTSNQGNSIFIDQSVPPNTITNAGSVTMNQGTFSPFSPARNIGSPAIEYNPTLHGGSAYVIPGTRLNAPRAAFNFGTGSFTIDLWVYPTRTVATTSSPTDNSYCMLGAEDSGSGVQWQLTVTNGLSYRGLTFAYGQLGTYSVGKYTNNYLTPNQWHHIVVQRDGTTFSIYVNGVSQTLATYEENSTWSDSFDFNNTTVASYRVGHEATRQPYYLSNVRLVKGAALYTGATFAVPTAPTTAVTGTSLLLNFTNSGIKDLSCESVLSVVGDAKIDTFRTKHGTGSIVFNGTADYLTIPHNDIFKFGTNDFTIEWWWYSKSAYSSGSGPCMGQKRGDAYGGWVIYRDNTTATDKITLRLAGQSGANSTSFATTVTPAANTWEHWAVVRSGTTVTWYRGGVECGTTTGVNIDVTETDTGAPMYIGFAQTWGYVIADSNIDDLRITNGRARYTANFTPPGPILTK